MNLPIHHTTYNIQHNLIYIPTNKGPVSVCLQHVIRIQGISNYSRIYFNDGRFPLTVARVLKKLELALPQGMFIRSHKAHLVNKNFVEEVNLKQGCICLRNGETIAISRRKKRKELLNF